MRRQVSLGFCEETFPEGQHIVYVYADDDERKATMARYLLEGLNEHEKVLYLVHDISPEEMRVELEGLGVDTFQREEAFDLMTAHYKQCPGEVFSREYMLDVVARYYEGALAEGYVGARGAGEMSWAAAGRGVQLSELFEYEASLNELLERYPLTTVCQYDARKFPGDVIMKVLAAHPFAIVRGQLVQNPFYEAPAQH